MSGAASLLIASGGVGALLAWYVWAARPWAPPRHAASAPLSRPRPAGPPPPAPHRAEVLAECTCGVRSGEHKVWCGELVPPPGDWTDRLLADLHDAPTVLDDLRPEDGAEGCAMSRDQATSAVAPTGAGDESEAYGPPAPPAPPVVRAGEIFTLADLPGVPITIVPTRRATATDVALAHMDAFMVAMRADHAQWLADARERWAAA